MRFLGANAGTLRGENLLPGKENYISGSDSRSWHRNISTYSRARYSSLYPGIEAVFYVQRNQLEYYLIVAPGADPRSIRWEVQGADHLALMRNGELGISANSAVLAQHPPAIYQIINGQRYLVRGRFRLRGHLLTLSIPQYDRRRELIIDQKRQVLRSCL